MFSDIKNKQLTWINDSERRMIYGYGERHSCLPPKLQVAKAITESEKSIAVFLAYEIPSEQCSDCLGDVNCLACVKKLEELSNLEAKRDEVAKDFLLCQKEAPRIQGQIQKLTAEIKNCRYGCNLGVLENTATGGFVIFKGQPIPHIAWNYYANRDGITLEQKEMMKEAGILKAHECPVCKGAGVVPMAKIMGYFMNGKYVNLNEPFKVKNLAGFTGVADWDSKMVKNKSNKSQIEIDKRLVH
jgi:hypothetical protein